MRVTAWKRGCQILRKPSGFDKDRAGKLGNSAAVMGMADFSAFDVKMRAAGLGDAAICAFSHAFGLYTSGASAFIPESAIAPASGLPESAVLPESSANRTAELVAATVVIKLNGGLGTGMGLEKAKSLLEVKDGLTFLDLIARQILHQRQAAPGLRFLLMNSFSTSQDSLDFLARYPELGCPADIELMQNKVPKICHPEATPLTWPNQPAHEWCPPGHGDIYAALLGSGWLEKLCQQGVRYAFISNSDNLGATLDPAILAWFAASDAPFLMEVTRRTEADKKGGHLALRRSDNRLVLRESAQCLKSDEAEFQNIERHQFFNTNNLWLRLDRLKETLEAAGGLLPLPVMQNFKTADPRDPKSPAVVQLETAMGAAIECFPGSRAIIVPRDRFAPVKTTADLLGLRSDACRITDDWRIELLPERNGQPPVIALDNTYHKMVDGLESAFGPTAPSLRHCQKLTVRGPVRIPPAACFAGNVEILNPTAETRDLPADSYCDTRIVLEN